jgi:hypothetical protein
MAGPCENVLEGGYFHNWLSVYQLLKKVSVL